MGTLTVVQPRAEALQRRIAALDGAPARLEAVALGLVDGLLEGDDDALAAALDALRDARARADGDPELAGWLDAAIAVAHWGLERLPSRVAVAPGTRAGEFLRALGGASRTTSADVRRALEVDETQVSRTGRALLERGLVTRHKAGRQVSWGLTPRGRQALAALPARERGNAAFWQDALRRGFRAASGGDPGERGESDPTRERIVECTSELHLRHGIGATTREDIAASAGVPLETVDALFPTMDHLVRSCGAHFMERLQLPATDQAGAVFAGAASEDERIHRLVETVFGAYERGADGLTVARRERRDLVPVDECIEELDRTLDMLVAEALGPEHPDPPAVASVRALTDVEMWRALRDRGAEPAEAVDRASAAVERWLEARPAR